MDLGKLARRTKGRQSLQPPIKVRVSVEDHIKACGQGVKWTVKPIYHFPKPVPTRGPSTSFSKQARLRALLKIASIDWQRAEPCLFTTLTYPPELHGVMPNTITRHRSEFWRYIEKHVGRHVPAFWRVEWLPRESGIHAGEIAPHIHLLIYTVPFIAWQDVAIFWMRTINFYGYIRTEIRKAKSKKQAGYYASKYAAKSSGINSLVNVPYLNNLGRQWGILREDCLPKHQKHDCELPKGARTEYARKVALQGLPQHNEYGNESFTLLGPRASVVQEILFGNLLDDMIPGIEDK
jgi:hypothetical protein